MPFFRLNGSITNSVSWMTLILFLKNHRWGSRCIFSKKVELWGTKSFTGGKIWFNWYVFLVHSFPFLSSFLFRSEAGSIIKIWIIYEEPLKWVACRLVKDSRTDTELHFFYSLTIDDTSNVCLENKLMNLKLLEEKYVNHCDHLHWSKQVCIYNHHYVQKHILCVHVHKRCFCANNSLILSRNIIIKGNNFLWIYKDMARTINVLMGIIKCTFYVWTGTLKQFRTSVTSLICWEAKEMEIGVCLLKSIRICKHKHFFF